MESNYELQRTLLRSQATWSILPEFLDDSALLSLTSAGEPRVVLMGEATRCLSGTH